MPTSVTDIKLKRTQKAIDNNLIKTLELNFGEPLFLDSENALAIGGAALDTSVQDLPVFKAHPQSVMDKYIFMDSTGDLIDEEGTVKNVNLDTTAYKATANKAGAVKHYIVENINVAAGSWVSDTTYEEYPYKAVITVTGCTANHFPTVILTAEDALSGNYAPVAETGTNSVTIYAKKVPTQALTIKSIEIIL